MDREAAPFTTRTGCFSTVIRDAGGLEAELLAEIDAADIDVGDDLLRRAFHEHAALMKDVGAIDDVERLAHIVVGDQHTDAAILEMGDEVANVAHRDRVDAGERL